jgi:multidrug efflux pump subunit AcrA (membrane-fusion protein)
MIPFWYRRAVALLAGAALCTSAIAAAPSDQPDPRIIRNCIGTPSEQHRLTFEGDTDGTAVIKTVNVKPGDTVKAGDVLMTEDTDQATAELAYLKAGADATGKIDEAKVTIDGKSKLVDMYTKLSNGNYSGVELINAQLDRDVAIARLKQAKEEHDEAELGYQRQLVKIQHMSLRSPIDGVVESVSLYAGEPVDANADKQGAAFVVSNDPLWIEFHLSAEQAAKLSMKDAVEAAFPDSPDHWISGQIVFLDPMVEYVGQTRTIRVSIPNPDHRPSGLPMIVRLPQKVVDDTGGAVGTAQP